MSSGPPNKDPPMDGSDNDAVQDVWEPGLRRRRGRGSSSTTSNSEEPPRQNTIERSRPNGNGNSHNDSTPGPSSPIGGNNFAASGIGDTNNNGIGGLPCSGGGGVGLLTSPAAAGGTMGGGAPFHTPHKTPSKDTPGLVAAPTPSSVTTAGETAESTLMSNSPLRVRHRSSRRRNGRPSASSSAPSLQRQYQLLRSQILLLLGSASIGLILFLFYALPLAAFISLIMMVSSMGALLPVARSALRARYELEMEHPLGLTRYLPDSLRVMLTETTLHEFMTDTTFMMEHRYLMLYFMPGLQPEQLMDFIDQLPPRHREALLQPGLGRMMPSVMGNLMRLDNHAAAGPHGNGDALQLENGDDASSASGLTVDREHDGENGSHDGTGDGVTLLEAVAGLPRTLGGFALDNRALTADDVAPAPGIETPAVPTVATQVTAPQIANPTPVNVQNHVNTQDDDDNSSIDFSIDLSVGLNNIIQNQAPATPAAAAEHNNNAELRNVIVELPESSHPESNHNDDQNQEEIQQQEYDLEGRILSEAASAAVANFSAQASAAARETATEAMDTTSSWLIRAGSFTGLIAGGGGIMTAIFANHRAGVTLGSMSGLISDSSASGGANRSSSSSSNAASERQSGYQSIVYGLFATSAFGFASAGVAYVARNRVRAAIAANRERRLKDAAEKDDKADAK